MMGEREIIEILGFFKVIEAKREKVNKSMSE